MLCISLGGTEKEVLGLKEMMLELKKVVDQMADDIRENSSYRRRDESGTSNGSVMKLKGKMDDLEPPLDNTIETVDRKHFFEINELPEAEKVKVVVMSFGQDEVDQYRWSHNRKKVESWSDLKERMFHHFSDTQQGV
ncbi:retrotransposon protein [Cucumis melo var. makuwa]|uniref:Retrotransposon protein n=1 Tax=Cucumis melo var. makuwa TaxID=1194695 RepID=A0A5A7V1Q7_CUCMM|nr:retrotransposon protein [Cucumis melo var. makuwa]TYK04947.1 retrotransposon protein [Cucumis melo var. makuwa]